MKISANVQTYIYTLHYCTYHFQGVFSAYIALLPAFFLDTIPITKASLIFVFAVRSLTPFALIIFSTRVLLGSSFSAPKRKESSFLSSFRSVSSFFLIFHQLIRFPRQKAKSGRVQHHRCSQIGTFLRTTQKHLFPF